MALQVWLPLNGDLMNRGVYEIQPTRVGTLGVDAGKVTPLTYKWDTDGQAVSLPNFMNTFKTYANYSISAWVYCSGAATNHSAVICSSGDWNVASGQTCFALNTYNAGYNKVLVPNTKAWSEGVTVNTISLNEWHHIAVTYNGTTSTVYVDGVAAGTYSGGGITSASNSANLYIGAATYYSGFTLKGRINDFRIYDHCCSAREIAEVAKGLVAHYPMHNNYNSMPNLLTNSLTEVSNNAYNTNIYYTESAPEAGKVYTLTICATPGEGVTHLSPYLSAGYKGLGNMVFSGTGPQILTLTFTAAYYAGREPSVSTSYGYIYIYRFPKTGVTSDVTLHWAKLEEGNKSTGYLPHSTEDVTNDRVYDESGYGNHAYYYNAVKFSADAPRHNCSTVFSGSQAVCCRRGPMVTDEITVNLWAKVDDWSTYSNSIRIMSCTESGGWNFENTGRFVCYADGNYRIATGNFTQASEGWHMITGSWDGKQAKIYFDGVLQGSSTALSSKKPITYHASNGIFIGAEAAGSSTTPGSPFFVGSISDVRIYGTALSQEDILELYQVAATVSDNGSVFGYDLKEV